MKARDLIIPYFKSHRRAIGIGLSSLIVVDFLQLMIPRVIKWAVDDLTLLRADLEVLLRHAGAVVVMAVLIGGFRYVWRRCLLGTARYLEADLRNRLLGHIQALPALFFDRAKTGDLMAHATNDIQQVRMAAGMGLVALNDAIVLGLAAIGFMLYIHVQLTLYVLIPMPLIVIGTRLLGRRMHHRYQKVQAAFADMTEALRERCAGIHIIKAHNAEPAALQAAANVSRAYLDQNMKLVGVVGLFFPFMMMLTNVSLAIVLYFGGRGAILAEITPGDLVAFISYLNLLSWPMMALGWVTNLVQRGGASLERLKRILQIEPAIKDRPDARPLARPEGRIAFEQVRFAFNGAGDRTVLADLTFQAGPGRLLGVVGPPGSGKSTLLSLVPRLYDVSEGRVTVDGRDVRDITLADLRRHIAYVPQEPFMFSGTVRDNILFGCPRRCQGGLTRAIADAGLAETLSHFPAGLDTVVGEKGVMLSGGQKQRIALARAFLIDAPILLLDDPISQVDTATAAVILAAVRRMTEDKTVVVASHRLAAVRTAHWIISLQEGRMVEAGTHQQLITARGYYARVHALQELADEG